MCCGIFVFAKLPQMRNHHVLHYKVQAVRNAGYILNEHHDMAMTYNYKQKKISAILSSNLEAGVALNVIGHLAISIGAYSDKEELMGRPYLQDASGVNHAGIAKYPFVITKANRTKLRKIIVEARLNKLGISRDEFYAYTERAGIRLALSLAYNISALRMEYLQDKRNLHVDFSTSHFKSISLQHS